MCSAGGSRGRAKARLLDPKVRMIFVDRQVAEERAILGESQKQAEEKQRDAVSERRRARAVMAGGVVHRRPEQVMVMHSGLGVNDRDTASGPHRFPHDSIFCGENFPSPMLSACASFA